MFTTLPIATIPQTSESKKLIDAIKDQTDGVPSHLVFVIDIVSIRFGGYFTPQIKATLQRFTSLQMLTLNDCGIKSLQNFPHLPGLIRLDLVFNQITGQSLSNIRGSRHLQTLMLGANKIQKLEQVETIRNLKQLLQLDLINNPVSKLPGYRQKIFAIFPSISILDTLDKSGKDAYSSSSMVLAASRVPDALFDKGPSAFPPIPAPTLFVSPPILPPTSSVLLPSSIAIPPRTTVSATATTTGALHKSTIKTKNIKINKPIGKGKGKAGKSGKSTVKSKSTSISTRAGLVFPVGRLKRKLKQTTANMRVSKNASIYLGAILEYLSAQVLEGAGNIAKQDKKKRIVPSHIKKSLKNDEQLFKLLKGVTLSVHTQ